MKVPKYFIYEVKAGEPIFSDIENGVRGELPITVTDITLDDLLEREVPMCRECFWYYQELRRCENTQGIGGAVQPWDYCSKGKKNEQVQEREDGRV